MAEAKEIDGWLQDNYHAIVADENRAETYDSIADLAEANDSPELAAWARGEAARAGKNITPKQAKPAEKETRSSK